MAGILRDAGLDAFEAVAHDIDPVAARPASLLQESAGWWRRAGARTYGRWQELTSDRMQALQGLWSGAELEAVATRKIDVRRTFASFDDFWMIETKSPAIASTIAAMASGDVETLKSRVRARLPADTEGRITCGARAHAIKGHLPK